MRSAVYPGTFDPITNGHLDLIVRSLSVFDRVIVAVAKNPAKAPLFSAEERVALIREATTDLSNLDVIFFDGLLVDLCRTMDVHVVIRGLRAVSDFEYELQMSQMNRKLNENVETVFMMPSEEHTFLSSKLIKEIASYGGNVTGLVPEAVSLSLLEKFRGKNG